MKYWISACLTSLGVVAMLVSACGGGGGSSAPSTQAVVFIALSTATGQKDLSGLQFQLLNDPSATTFDTGSAVAIDGAAGGKIASKYDRPNRINTVAFARIPSFPISARQPFIQINYVRDSGSTPGFKLFSSVKPPMAVFENLTTPIKRSDFRITVQYR